MSNNKYITNDTSAYSLMKPSSNDSSSLPSLWGWAFGAMRAATAYEKAQFKRADDLIKNETTASFMFMKFVQVIWANWWKALIILVANTIPIASGNLWIDAGGKAILSYIGYSLCLSRLSRGNTDIACLVLEPFVTFYATPYGHKLRYTTWTLWSNTWDIAAIYGVWTAAVQLLTVINNSSTRLGQPISIPDPDGVLGYRYWVLWSMIAVVQALLAIMAIHDEMTELEDDKDLPSEQRGKKLVAWRKRSLNSISHTLASQAHAIRETIRFFFFYLLTQCPITIEYITSTSTIAGSTGQDGYFLGALFLGVAFALCLTILDQWRFMAYRHYSVHNVPDAKDILIALASLAPQQQQQQQTKA
jgi:hypothetical protein